MAVLDELAKVRACGCDRGGGGTVSVPASQSSFVRRKNNSIICERNNERVFTSARKSFSRDENESIRSGGVHNIRSNANKEGIRPRQLLVAKLAQHGWSGRDEREPLAETAQKISCFSAH